MTVKFQYSRPSSPPSGTEIEVRSASGGGAGVVQGVYLDGANTLSITQNVTADDNNSSTTNLSATNGYTFTGAATSTLGVAGIQVSLYADKNCTVRVEQSPDSTPHWDLIDTYYYKASGNFGVTVQAISSYVRVVVTTANETTTTFRLQTALCPIVEAVPRSLDENGNFRIATPMDEYGFESENTPMGEVRMVEPFRLVGATFEGAVIDSNFWTSASNGTGASITQGGGQLLITSGTSASAVVTAYSTRRARYVGGAGMRYRAVVQADAGTENNVRRWGIGWGSSAMPTVTDGAWFQLNGASFQAQVMKGGSASTITTFNGHLGTSYDPGTSVNTYEIYWTNSKVWFSAGDLLHTFKADTETWSSTMNFHAFMDSTNSAAASSVRLMTRVATIYRLGKIETAPIWAHLTAGTGTVLKRGPGRLHHIVFNTFSNGATVVLYDAVTATNVIASTAPVNNIYPGNVLYNLDFYNGLTVTITGTVDLTIVYE